MRVCICEFFNISRHLFAWPLNTQYVLAIKKTAPGKETPVLELCGVHLCCHYSQIHFFLE